MSDSAKEMKPAAIVGPSLREKKRKKRLSVDSGNSTSQMLCAPGEHAISDNTPSGAVPLHPSSFSSSPRGDVGSSEVDVDVASSEVSTGLDDSVHKAFLTFLFLGRFRSLFTAAFIDWLS